MKALLSALLLTCAVAGPAVAQTPAPDNSALTAQSAALTPDQKAQAQKLFATAFTLWQSGDFAAAEIAFRQGLAIDPANGMANYYYGDCLARRNDKKDAKDYLARAASLGAGTAEGFKAQAQLQALSVVHTNVAEMTPDELKDVYTGQWTIKAAGNEGLMQIAAAGGLLRASGTFHGNMWSSCAFGGTVNGLKIGLTCDSGALTGDLLSPTHMEGLWNGYHWTGDKQ